MIKNVVLEILASNQKNRLLEEAGSGPSSQESYPGPSLLPGEAELAYLTHEGLFISDALNEAQQQQQQQVAVQDQSSVAGSRVQQSRAETAGSDSTSGTAETSADREQSFMYVHRLTSWSLTSWLTSWSLTSCTVCPGYSGGFYCENPS